MGIHHRRLLIVQTQTPQKAEAPWIPSLTRQCLEYYLQDQLLMAVPIRNHPFVLLSALEEGGVVSQGALEDWGEVMYLCLVIQM